MQTGLMVSSTRFFILTSSQRDHVDLAASAVNSWYDEVKLYNWSSPGFTMDTGHFTQVVWASSKQLGVGVACSSDKKRCYVKQSPCA
jgi:hypothetical protein